MWRKSEHCGVNAYLSFERVATLWLLPGYPYRTFERASYPDGGALCEIGAIQSSGLQILADDALWYAVESGKGLWATDSTMTVLQVEVGGFQKLSKNGQKTPFCFTT